jgi:hypothetical protein
MGVYGQELINCGEDPAFGKGKLVALHACGIAPCSSLTGLAHTVSATQVQGLAQIVVAEV